MAGLMILVAGPYRSGTDGDPARIRANVDAMTTTALALWRRGHLPVMGEWFALPLIEAADRRRRRPDAVRRDLPPDRRAAPRALRRLPPDRRPVRRGATGWSTTAPGASARPVWSSGIDEVAGA